MEEIDPSQLGPNELYLSGLLQVDAAIGVLEVTGFNKAAGFKLKAIRGAYFVAGTVNQDPRNFKIHMSGGSTSEMKADISTSALLVEANQTLPSELRTAAAGLLDFLGVER
jgi:hypothetical protein